MMGPLELSNDLGGPRGPRGRCMLWVNVYAPRVLKPGLHKAHSQAMQRDRGGK